MRNAKVDANQPQIVRALRQAGATVQSLAEIGSGCPDILIGFRGQCYVAEVKDWRQPPSKRKLTPLEKKWHQTWQGQIAIVETPDEALKLIGVI